MENGNWSRLGKGKIVPRNTKGPTEHINYHSFSQHGHRNFFSLSQSGSLGCMVGCMQSCRFKMGRVEGHGSEGPRMLMQMWLKVLVLRPKERNENID